MHFSWLVFSLAIMLGHCATAQGQTLPPIATVSPPIFDLGIQIVAYPGALLQAEVKTTRAGARLSLIGAFVLPVGSTYNVLAPLGAVLSDATPVSLTVEPTAFAPVRDSSANVVLVFKNVGPDFPDLAANAEYRVTLPIRSSEVCDPATATCNLNGPLCTIDVANEAHTAIKVPAYPTRTWPAVEQHLVTHNRAIDKYELPLAYLIDALGLRSFVSDDPTECTGSCPCACNPPEIHFLKPMSRASQATFEWSAPRDLIFRGRIPGLGVGPDLAFEVTVPRKMEGFVTVGPSHSEFVFDTERELLVHFEDQSTSPVTELLDGRLSCLGVSTYRSVLRPKTLSDAQPHLTLTVSEPP